MTEKKSWDYLCNLIKKNAYDQHTVMLTSGRISDFYVDCKQVTLDPEGAYIIANIILEQLEGQSIDAVGGPSIGADPIVGAVVTLSAERQHQLRGFIIRKQTKMHGKQQQIEGPLKVGDRVVVIEDVLTTGASVLRAIQAIEEYGCQVIGVIVIVDRQENGKQLVERCGYPVWAIITHKDLMNND